MLQGVGRSDRVGRRHSAGIPGDTNIYHPDVLVFGRTWALWLPFLAPWIRSCARTPQFTLGPLDKELRTYSSTLPLLLRPDINLQVHHKPNGGTLSNADSVTKVQLLVQSVIASGFREILDEAGLQHW